MVNCKPSIHLIPSFSTENIDGRLCAESWDIF